MISIMVVMTKEKNNITMQHFKELLTPIYTDFFRFIYSIVRNKAIADDVVQNSLLLACKSFKDLREQDKFKSWLFSIGKREAIRTLKTYSREILTDFDVLPLVSHKYNPEEIIIKEESKQKIIQIINGLRNDYRDLVLLRYYAGLSLEEIAGVLNMNYNTVRSNHIRVKDIILREFQKSQNQCKEVLEYGKR